MFVNAVGEVLAREIGTEAAVSHVSPTALSLFLSSPGISFGAFDLLWAFPAVGTAWSIPKGIGIKA